MISTAESSETFETAVEERDLDVLAHLHESQISDVKRVSQRSIAKALGMSVGLTNAILKRLVEKGFVMVRRINQNNAHYLVTPQGIQQIGKRSYLYLRRTIGHVVRYKERLRDFCRQQAAAGIREIVLVGESDLAFLLEWCAQKEGLRFRHLESAAEFAATHRSVVGLFSEHLTRHDAPEAVSLHTIVTGLL